MARTPVGRYDIIRACNDPALFAPWFKDRASWRAWLAFLRHLFGLVCSPSDLQIIKERTGRLPMKRHRYTEAWLIVGRRGGKSQIVALIAVFLAFFYDWRPYLSPGEYGTIIIVAADRLQARTILRYIKGFVDNIPFFKKEKTRDTAMSVEFLKRRIAIEVHTTSFRATRGYTIVAALLDEVAFWRADDTAHPDEEVIAAIRPGMATIPGAMLLAASSPYSRRGVLYDTHKKYFGQEDQDILVWHGDTKSMNPSISQKWLDRQYDKDPVRAAAEYGAQFRSDIEDFVPEEVVDACIDIDAFERPYFSKWNYTAFADPSGGSQDSFALSIGHPEGTERHVDLIREWPAPFDPDEVIDEAAKLIKAYAITKVSGDNYAGNWPIAKFKKLGVVYEPCGVRKSDLYRDALPILNAKGAHLLNNRKMKTQIISLERRNSRGGKFMIDHPVGGKDDVANAVLGLLARMHAVSVDFNEDQVFVGPDLDTAQAEGVFQSLGAM